MGIAIGLGAAALLTRFMTSLLYEISPGDPATFTLIPVILLGVALAASFVPARRATRIDPMVALRHE
jgi:putative ABC transport system permease protein